MKTLASAMLGAVIFNFYYHDKKVFWVCISLLAVLAIIEECVDLIVRALTRELIRRG